MQRYDDLKKVLNDRNLAERFQALPEAELKKLVGENPNAPADYIDFLREIGYGDIGDGHYMIYSGLIAPEDVFDAGVAEKLDGILLFGDDFSGFCGGFATNKNWDLIEVDGCSDPYEPEMTFEEFIRGKINTYLAL